MKRFTYIMFFSFLVFILFFIGLARASSLASRLSGKILLQVEQNGEAWYVNPSDEKRYYMGRPSDAFDLMRSLGVGITTENLNKIPVAEANFSGVDTDGDGLSDVIEDAFTTNKNSADTDGDGFSDKSEILNGYDPTKPSKRLPLDPDFASKHLGKIFLQVEQNGEAWYIYPADGKRYFLSRPSDAFEIMRSLGLGITDSDLKQITVATEIDLEEMDKELAELGESLEDELGNIEDFDIDDESLSFD